MSNDHYPAGVTDAHPHFNPDVTYREFECGADEATVIPSFAVKAALIELETYINALTKGRLMDERPHTVQMLQSVVARVQDLQRQIDGMEQDCEYECGWKGELELDVSPEAEWDCPRCGNTRTTDTLPEGQDPDDAYDRMREARYDD